MKKLFFAMPLLLAATLFSAQACDTMDKEEYKQGHGMTEDQMTSGYNSPGRIDVKEAWDFFITGSFIYWQPKQDGVEAAVLFEQRTIAAPVHQEDVLATLVNLDIDFDPGFKVGLGMNAEMDHWDIYLEYTRLHTKNSKQIRRDDIPGEVNYTIDHEPWADVDTHGTNFIRGTWYLDYDMLDLEVGRSYYAGTKLTLRPFAGIRGGWIDQKYCLNGEEAPRPQGARTFYGRSKSNSWLIGPRFGMNTKWHLGEGVRIFANSAASIFYQNFNVTQRYVIPQQENYEEVFVRRYCDDKAYVNASVEAILGLGWGSYFSDDTWHVDISAGYEFHLFWHQNMMRRLFDRISEDADGAAAALAMHGLNISLRVDF